MIKIIIFYLFIGIFRTMIFFLQPWTNMPMAFIKRQWGLIFFNLIFWFPLLIFHIIRYGTKIILKSEIRALKNAGLGRGILILMIFVFVFTWFLPKETDLWIFYLSFIGVVVLFLLKLRSRAK